MMGCRYATQGDLQITPEGESERARGSDVCSQEGRGRLVRDDLRRLPRWRTV